MAKYTLTKSVAGAKSFRHNGKKYETRQLDQKILKKLYKEGFEHVNESNTKKVVKNEQKENNESND